MRRRGRLLMVGGLGVLVALSTVLQAMQVGGSEAAWRPYVLLGAVTAGVVAVLQLVTSLAIGRVGPGQGWAAQPLGRDDPHRLGDFRIVGRLGAGAMGRAYLAWRPGTDEYVAIKVIRPEYADSGEFRRRFAREVRTIGRVDSRYTARLVGADPDAAQPWLATSYVPGAPLQEVVEARGPLPTRAVWRLAADAARALGVIHAAGVVHRDLKPSNIILGPHGARVIDFGIAQLPETTGLTSTANRPGTPSYMAPEQAIGATVGPAADIFALGVVLAFAATARTPFGDGSSDALLYRVVHQPPDLSGIDEPLRRLISDCLAKEPADRPTVAQIMELTGAQVAADSPSWPVEEGVLPASGPAVNRPASRFRWAGLVVGTAALLIATASVTLQLLPAEATPGGMAAGTTTPPYVATTLAIASASPTTPNVTPSLTVPSVPPPTTRKPSPTPRRTTVVANPIPLSPLAPAATWSNATRTFVFGGDHEEEWGSAASKTSASDPLEDGSQRDYLVTYPEWIPRGEIHGTFTLPRPLVAGDRFQAFVGFEEVTNPPATDQTEFRVTASEPGRPTVFIGRVHESNDGTLSVIDFDLTSVAGYRHLTLSVIAPSDNNGPTERTVWVDPSVERTPGFGAGGNSGGG